MQTLEIKIDWSDLDLLGHVNNVAIIRYFQSGRVTFCDSIGIPAVPGMHFGPIEAATEVKFCKQIHYPSTITLQTAVIEVKNTSFILEHKIFDHTGEIAAVGKEVIVYFDFQKQTKIMLTDELKNKLFQACEN